MNSLFQKITAATGLISLLGAAACQNDNLVVPDSPTAIPSQTVSSDISPNLSQTVRLIKNGQATLTYYPDGRLKQVTIGAPVRGSLAYSRKYTYDDVNHAINATSYSGGKVILIDVYYLNEKGLCLQSTQVDYTILDKPNPVNIQLNAQWYYQYNKEGQLEHAHNLFLPGSDRIDYVYDSAGDMIKMTTYDRVAGQDRILIQTLTLTYTQSPSLRGTAFDDQYPLNASWVRLPVPDESTKGQPVPDQYLPIFGKPSKHLIVGAVQTQLPGNKLLLNSLFTYRLNPAGYVIERKELDAHSTSVLDTKPYAYQVTAVGVQF